MGRQRYSYLLFKKQREGEPVLAGSFSSMKRARGAIREDARKDFPSTDNGDSVEYVQNGAIFRCKGLALQRYYIRKTVEDELISDMTSGNYNYLY